MPLLEGHLLNDKALMRALEGLPDKLRDKALREAQREEMRPVLDEARQKARLISPRLAKTMKLRKLKTKRPKTIGIAVITGSRAELEIGPSEYFWPAAFEFGTKERFSRGASRGRIGAQSFMRGPLLRRRGTMLTRLARRVRQRVDGIVAAEIRRGMKNL